MTEVALSYTWHKDMIPDEFFQWLEDNNIVNWNFRTDGDPSDNPVRSFMIFEHDDDALAFRIRFGV